MKPLALALRTTAIPLPPTTARASKSPPAGSPSNSRTSKPNNAPPTTTKTTPPPATTRAVQKNTSTTIRTSRNRNQRGLTAAVAAATASPAATTTSATRKTSNLSSHRAVSGTTKRSESSGDERLALEMESRSTIHNSGYVPLSLSCGPYLIYPSIRHSFGNACSGRFLMVTRIHGGVCAVSAARSWFLAPFCEMMAGPL